MAEAGGGVLRGVAGLETRGENNSKFKLCASYAEDNVVNNSFARKQHELGESSSIKLRSTLGL